MAKFLLIELDGEGGSGGGGGCAGSGGGVVLIVILGIAMFMALPKFLSDTWMIWAILAAFIFVPPMIQAAMVIIIRPSRNSLLANVRSAPTISVIMLFILMIVMFNQDNGTIRDRTGSMIGNGLIFTFLFYISYKISVSINRIIRHFLWPSYKS